MAIRPLGGNLALDWEALQAATAGEVILRDAPEYASACRLPVARFDGGFLTRAQTVRPEAVVLCKEPADVSATIAFARRFGLETAARSGGHCFTGHSWASGIVIDVSPMSSVSVSDLRATVGAGARLGEVYDALEVDELTIAAGCGATVGIAGLALGGGVGILGRLYGLTCDQLLGAEVVLADGRVVDCDEEREEELFWALRGGGGGNFGVVTSFLFRTVPAPSSTAFHLVWPFSDAAGVMEAWQGWAPDAPDELAASVLITVPGNLDRAPLVNVFGAMVGTESESSALLDELVGRIGTDPVTAAFEQGSFVDTKKYLGGLGDQFEEIERDQTQPVHSFSKSEFFAQSLPTEAVAALAADLGERRVAGESRELDCMPFGGAYNRVAADATAFPHRGARFLLKHTVVVEPEASRHERDAARLWLARSWESVHPWASGGVYVNFPDPDLVGAERAYYGANYERLLSVKQRYDPDNFFRFR
jgi:FAD/FMN-containing dehydrogenase